MQFQCNHNNTGLCKFYSTQLCQPKFVYSALCTLYFHVAIQRWQISKLWDPPKTGSQMLGSHTHLHDCHTRLVQD